MNRRTCFLAVLAAITAWASSSRTEARDNVAEINISTRGLVTAANAKDGNGIVAYPWASPFASPTDLRRSAASGPHRKPDLTSKP